MRVQRSVGATVLALVLIGACGGGGGDPASYHDAKTVAAHIRDAGDGCWAYVREDVSGGPGEVREESSCTVYGAGKINVGITITIYDNEAALRRAMSKLTQQACERIGRSGFTSVEPSAYSWVEGRNWQLTGDGIALVMQRLASHLHGKIRTLTLDCSAKPPT